jgi:hypothetical protein
MNDPTIVGLIVTFILAQLGLHLDSRRQSRKTDGKIDEVGQNADTAVIAAKLAADRSKPISNGFADDVRKGFSDLKDGQASITEDLREVKNKIDRHIADHASADVLRRKKVNE